MKISKYLELNRKDFNQIICYYILSLMGGINSNAEDINIKSIGIYYARFGLLWKTEIASIATNEVINVFKNWLFAYCREDGLTYDAYNANMLFFKMTAQHHSVGD